MPGTPGPHERSPGLVSTTAPFEPASALRSGPSPVDRGKTAIPRRTISGGFSVKIHPDRACAFCRLRAASHEHASSPLAPTKEIIPSGGRRLRSDDSSSVSRNRNRHRHLKTGRTVSTKGHDFPYPVRTCSDGSSPCLSSAPQRLCGKNPCGGIIMPPCHLFPSQGPLPRVQSQTPSPNPQPVPSPRRVGRGALSAGAIERTGEAMGSARRSGFSA